MTESAGARHKSIVPKGATHDPRLLMLRASVHSLSLCSLPTSHASFAARLLPFQHKPARTRLWIQVRPPHRGLQRLSFGS